MAGSRAEVCVAEKWNGRETIYFILFYFIYLPHKQIIIQWKKLIQINIQCVNEIKKRKPTI